MINDDVLAKDLVEAEKLYMEEIDEIYQKGEDMIDVFLSGLEKEDTGTKL